MEAISFNRKTSTHLDESARVVSKALVRATAAWGLSQAQLASLLGLSDATISRLYKGDYVLDLQSKPGQCALVILRIYRSLDAMVGGNDEKAKAWLCSHNHHLLGVPLTLMTDVATLSDVANYLDALRGKV